MTDAPPPAPSPPSIAAPLSIAVVGLGGIGSTFAFQLARAGHEVTAVARPGSARLEQLRRDGGVVRTSGERADLRVADALDAAAAYDLVIVTTLAHQAEALVPALRASQARTLHFMFNNLHPERLSGALGAERCSFGMPFVMGVVERDGRLNATITPSRKTLHGDRRWVALFDGAGIPSAFEADMPLWLRCHVPLCIAMESISVAAQRRGGGASWAEAMTVARGLRAGLAIIKGLGYRLHPPAKAAMAAAPTPALAGMVWSVSRIPAFRDLLATGETECRALADALAAAGGGVEPPMPEAVKAVLRVKPAAV